jgi:hypothetical protein
VSLLGRLTRQLASKHVKNSSSVARALLIKRKDLDKEGKLTAKGKKRQALGKAGRAKDRAARYSGHKTSDFKYNPHTNRATLK